MQLSGRSDLVADNKFAGLPGVPSATLAVVRPAKNSSSEETTSGEWGPGSAGRWDNARKDYTAFVLDSPR